MRVMRDHVVQLRYRVTTPSGELVDEGRQPILYLHGGYGGIFDKLEQALEGQATGTALIVNLSAADAFGPYDDQLLKVERLDSLPPPVEVGRQYEADRPDQSQSDLYVVVEVRDGYAVLDANHPLAGQDLVFAMTIDRVRPASPEEIARRQPDVPDGPAGHPVR